MDTGFDLRSCVASGRLLMITPVSFRIKQAHYFMEKTEYIKQLKKLVKKYHPDLCNDEHLEAMYNETTKKLVNILNALKFNENIKDTISTDNVNPKNKLVTINNQDYAYYKLGIKYYKNIHPDMFYKKRTGNNYKTKTFDELVAALNTIFLSFNISEHYFGKIIEEYPQSNWVDDAKEKIQLLKKLYKRYENIVVEENQSTNYEQYVNDMGLKMM